MGISLFEHNEAAYTAAVDLMSETGKAAIIHPTGTGKSFIAFKLCEDNPDKRVCWLSPSEYILKTQIENLKKTGAEAPRNILFFTYAKLMYLSAEEMREIQPDFIILDEFHRCGAEMWGKSVDALLAMYPAVPLLGLSATNIRYLDNQRDMADELFDGNVASEMTLGEAIVRGILNPPKYVLAVYSCRNDLEKYERKVRSARNKVVKDVAEDELQKLRRALEKADGLDVVFEKHIEDKRGKYIVFCSNIEHLNEMKALAPEWFSKVDKEAHVYCAYSDDPEMSREFAAFKADESNHLKLLYCIDMLNEGIHIENVSGVILLRPTVSPIVYKQQIGRALSASKKRNAVIFDIALNIENLYSIDTIEEEMQAVMTYYLDHGMENKIVNREFKVIDEVRDCMELFDSLNETLTASWDVMYEAAKEYFQIHGNLNVSTFHITENGLSLGRWLDTQRKVYAGKKSGCLTNEQAEKLTDIGMRWQSLSDLSWETHFNAAKAYYAEHGNLMAPTADKYNGVYLGRWLAALRVCRKSGCMRNYRGMLTDERIAALDETGMVWDVPNYIWEQNYYAAVQYHKANGNLNVPTYYVTPAGIRLGEWLGRLRKAKRHPEKAESRIADEQIKKLDELGMNWDNLFSSVWNDFYAAACRYRKEHGNLDVPYSYRAADGCKLGQWISVQRRRHSKLSADRVKKLDALGMRWEAVDRWERNFLLLKQYYEENGNIDMPRNYKINGFGIAVWLDEQKRRMRSETGRNGKSAVCLTPEQISKLHSLGVRPDISAAELAWERQYKKAKAFYDENKALDSAEARAEECEKGIRLWLIAQRRKYRAGKLSQRQTALLNKIGMVWASPDPWQTGYEHAENYFKKFGNLAVNGDFACVDGYPLGRWLINQRMAYKSENADTAEAKKRIALLDNLDMVWNIPEEEWQSAYESVKKYKSQFGNLNIPRGFADESGRDLYSWLSEQKRKYRAQKLNAEKTALLTALGFDLRSSAEKQWNISFELARQYYRENGDLRILSTYRTSDGRWLGAWVRRQRQSRDKLTSQQIQRLDSIGMVWNAETGIKTCEAVPNEV